VPGVVPTIAAALALTVPGDVVELAPGTYLARLSFGTTQQVRTMTLLK